MTSRHILCVGIICLLSACLSSPNPQEAAPPHSPDDERMAWWREARFGMFIHWGLYAIPGGEWNGQRYDKISEWIMYNAHIPVAKYEALAPQFNPAKFDARAWAKLAKAAGMQYVVFTTKHHDGFAMFDSQVSDYDIVDATPFGRDVLREIVDAFRAEGLKIGFYYSQAQDWHHPGGTYWNIEEGGSHWDSSLQRVSLAQYMQQKAIPQVRELLTNYGKVDIFWWDTPRGMTEAAAKELQALLALQPGIISNNRLYEPWPGDFGTPEQRVPPIGLDYDWETCMTMNTSWGFKHWDENWKSPQQLIRYLVDAASKGGNYLLNVGPTPAGEIPAASIERLQAVGQWMQVNGESIYGSEASPFYKLFWGRCTQKRRPDGGTDLFLHVWDWPPNGELRVEGLLSDGQAHLLATSQPLATRRVGQDLLISLPEQAPDPINSVLRLRLAGQPEVISNIPAQQPDGEIVVAGEMINIYNKGYDTHAFIQGKGDTAYVEDWVADRAFIDALFRLKTPGTYAVEAEVATLDGPCYLHVQHGEQDQKLYLPDTQGQFQRVSLGNVTLSAPGVQAVVCYPERKHWHHTRVRRITFKPLSP